MYKRDIYLYKKKAKKMKFKKTEFKKLRECSGLTQEEFGKILGVTKVAVSHWEKENRPEQPSPHRVRAIADALSVSVSAISDLSDGTTSSLPSRARRKYAPQKRIPDNVELVTFTEEELKKFHDEILQQVDFPNRGMAVPLITQAAAATVNPVYMPLLDCVKEHSEQNIFFVDAKEGDFCIEVTGESMMPWYPSGTFLLVRPYQDITNGKRVVAVLSTGEILFKVFLKKGTKIALLSIDGRNGSRFEFDLANPDPDKPFIRYICRVIASQRNEDKLDSAMSEAGIAHFWEEELKNM